MRQEARPGKHPPGFSILLRLHSTDEFSKTPESVKIDPFNTAFPAAPATETT
jgi:hypothetical protein